MCRVLRLPVVSRGAEDVTCSCWSCGTGKDRPGGPSHDTRDDQARGAPPLVLYHGPPLASESGLAGARGRSSVAGPDAIECTRGSETR